jgi:hypothetical protein
MQPTSKNKIPDDEIDIGSITQKISRTISYVADLYIKNIFITLLFVFIAVVFSVTIKYSATKTYKSSFIIRPNDKTEKFHLKIIGDIQTLLKFGDFGGIARELKIDSLIAKSIKEIETVNPYVKNRTDSINSTEVTIEIRDYNNLLPVQNAILNYLEGNPYFHKIKELQKKQNELNMTYVNKDIQQLDSLKALQLNNYRTQRSGTNSLLLNELINPTASYTVQAERITKKANLIAQLVFIDNFQLIKSCVPVKEPFWPPRILLICTIMVPLFLLLCFLFLHFKNRPKKLPVN